MSEVKLRYSGFLHSSLRRDEILEQWVSFFCLALPQRETDYDTGQLHFEMSMKLAAGSEQKRILYQKVQSFILKCYSLVKPLHVFLLLRLKWHFLLCVFFLLSFRKVKLLKWMKKRQLSWRIHDSPIIFWSDPLERSCQHVVAVLL